MAEVVIKVKGYRCERCNHKWIPRNTERPVICPKCVHPETIISGEFKKISEYKKNEGVYCSSGRKKKIKKVFLHNHNGKLIEIKAQGCLPIKITPEHRILTIHVIQKGRSKKRKFSREFLDPEWIFAGNLRRRPICENKNDCGDYIVIPKIKGTFDKYKINLSDFTTKHGLKVLKGKKRDDFFKLNKDSAWLCGLYVAEGYSSPNKGELKFCLGKHEKNLIAKTINKINKINFSCNHRERETATEVTLYSRVLCRAFKEWFGKNAHSKKIPDFILNHLDLKIISSFLKGYIEGDGHIRRYGGRVSVKANTVSKILALQLQLLSVRLNDFFHITTVDFSKYSSNYKGRKISGGLQYVLRASAGQISKLMGEDKKPRHNKSYKIFDKYIAIPINSLKEIDYNGKVMNLETQEGNYLASNIVIKNCKSPYWNRARKNKSKKRKNK